MYAIRSYYAPANNNPVTCTRPVTRPILHTSQTVPIAPINEATINADKPQNVHVQPNRTATMLPNQFTVKTNNLLSLGNNTGFYRCRSFPDNQPRSLGMQPFNIV